VVPITSKGKGIATHVDIAPPEGGLTAASFVIAEQTRCIAKQRWKRKMSEVTPEAMAAVERVLRAVLDLGS
jgi:mRNA interferase MazF